MNGKVEAITYILFKNQHAVRKLYNIFLQLTTS